MNDIEDRLKAKTEAELVKRAAAKAEYCARKRVNEQRWREANREKIREQQNKRRDPEKDNARHRAKYAADPEKYRRKAADWRAAHREKHLASARASYQKKKAENPEAFLAAKRHKTLKKNYGLTAVALEQMKVAQNYECKVCGVSPEQSGVNGLVVDHCHTTGRVRGLLCAPCNRALGQAKDNYDILFKAAGYLIADAARHGELPDPGWPWNAVPELAKKVFGKDRD